jgi:hypothetical protein
MDWNESIEVGRQDEDSLLVGKWGCRGVFHCRERFHQMDGVRHMSNMQCVLTYTPGYHSFVVNNIYPFKLGKTFKKLACFQQP